MKFHNTALAVLAALGLGLVSTQASALTTVVTAATSGIAGSSAIDFDSVLYPVDNSNAVLPNMSYSGTAGGVGYTYADGALYNIDTSPILNITARPVGSADNYWSIGTSPAGQVGPGVATFSVPLAYYGFLWGSTDGFNKVEFFSDGALVGTVFAPVPAAGDQTTSKYMNVYASAGQQFTEIKFYSTNNAFETDNHAVIAVPEPETYAMLLAGLGLMGTIVRRRNKSKSA